MDNIATGEDVDDINNAIDDVQTDLDELLQSNNIYSSDIYINSIATLDFADALGEKLNIINGHVEIYATPEMDTLKLQGIVNRLKTIVGNFGYLSQNSSIGTIKFDSIVSAAEISVGVHHDISFASLSNNGDIRLGTNYSNKVKGVNFGKLLSVGQIGMTTISNTPANAAGSKISGTFSTGDAIIYSNADYINLGSLPYYNRADLTLTLDSGGNLDISALDDVDSTGKQTDLDLTITGAAMVSLPNYDDGDFSAKDVGTVDLPKFTADGGSITLSEVTHVKLGAITADITIGSGSASENDLETFDVTAAKGTDTSDKAPKISIWSTSAETVKIAGVTGDITIANSPSLDSVNLTADAVGTITINNNANLVDATIGGTAAGVVVTNNADIESLTIGSETVVSDVKDAKLDGVITVTGNSSLANLTVESDNIETLTITGNPDLTSVDLSALTKIGATGKPTVNIYDNDLTASRLTDDEDGATNVDNGKTGDKGSVSTSSGMETAKTYLGVVAADADATATVYFDTVDEFIDEAKNSTSNHAYNAAASTQVDQITVLLLTPSAGGGGAIKGKRSWIIPSNAGTLQVTAGSPQTALFANAGTPGNVTISGNAALDVSNITTTENLARATAAGLTLTAQKGGNSTATVSPVWYVSNGATSTILGERHTSATDIAAAVATPTHGFGADEVLTFKVGANTVTTTVVGGVTSSTLSSATLAIQAAYAAKYGPGGTASATAVASVTIAGGVLTVTGLDPGSRGHGLAVSLSVAPGTGTGTNTNGLALDWVIGTTRATTDNSTTSENVILTLESNTAGTLADTTTPTTITLGGGTLTVLTSTQLTNATDPNKGTYTAQTESRDDVTNAEDSSTPSTTASSFSRIGWL